MIAELNERSREIFRQIVETFMETGEPVGSRTLSKRLEGRLSPASIRNVMADLEDSGLLYAPHTSAGRVPTHAGLRLFVDGLMETGDVVDDDRRNIEARCQAQGRAVADVLTEATSVLSGLSQCAGLVFAPKHDDALRQVDFVDLGQGRALVVLVTEAGMVENRLIQLPPGVSAPTLMQAANYLSARLRGRTIAEAKQEIDAELMQRRAELDELAQRVVAAGLAVWGDVAGQSTLIVRGQAKLLDLGALGDLERIRQLFEELEQQAELMKLLDLAQAGQGVRIYIGAETNLFSLAGCSMVVAPFHNSRQKVVGAIGVIGPTRLNYARIVPMVDFTAQTVSRLLG